MRRGVGKVKKLRGKERKGRTMNGINTSRVSEGGCYQTKGEINMNGLKAKESFGEG